MNRLRSLLPACALLTLGLAGAAPGCTAPQTTADLATAPAAPAGSGFVFDDFAYATAEWTSVEGAPPAAHALFGRNPWCLDRACAETVVTRAWYRYLWPEPYFTPPDPASSLAVMPGGRLRFRLDAGAHRGDHERFPRQIASGFAARTGTWVARVRFSDLRAVPASEAEVIQAFWTMTPHSAVVGDPRDGEKAWGEMDHEFNNYFHFHERAARVANQTGFRDGAHAGIRPLALRAPEAGPQAPAYSCTYRLRPGEAIREGDAETCTGILASSLAVLLTIRNDGREAHFSVASADTTVHFAMATPPEPAPPAQPMMALFSQHIFMPHGRDAARLAAPQTLEVDWFYYTPDARRTLGAVRADVAAMRRRGHTRVNTVAGLRLALPYAPTAGLDCGAETPYETLCHAGLRSLHPLAVEISGPERLAAGQTGVFVARLPLRGGDYRVDWSFRYRYADGRTGRWRHRERAYFRLTVPMDDAAEAVEVRVRVQEYRYVASTGTFEAAGPVVTAAATAERAPDGERGASYLPDPGQ